MRAAASGEFQLCGQIPLIEELKSVIVYNIQSLMLACFGSEATNAVVDMCYAPRDERDSKGQRWVERWAGDVSAIFKRSFDEAFSSVCRQDIAPETPTPNTDTTGTGLATLFAGFSTSHPRNIFFATLRRVIAAVTKELLIDSDAMDILEANCAEIRDVCEKAIRRRLGTRADEVFHFEPLSSEANRPTCFSMLWELAWGSRVVGGFTDWVASVAMDSISRDLKDASTEELERFLQPYCECMAPRLAGDIKDDSEVRNIFLNWISSGWIDLPDDDSNGGDLPQGDEGLELDVHEAFGTLRGQITETLQAVYAGSQQDASREAICRALGSVFDYRRVLHRDIMRRLARPGLNDRTGMGPFFAKVFLEECDKELVTIFSVLVDEETSVTSEAELRALQQVERNWGIRADR
ncbi:hypothetical protein IL306_004667 [Fusarium sp. DS 682]|nr:hypothetical protein IL306_004667 [Fusarium sp. DS 682]